LRHYFRIADYSSKIVGSALVLIEHVAGILACLPARYQIPFYFLAECGSRSGETALDVSDVDLQRQTVCIQRAIWRGHIDTPKTGSSMRRFYISAALTAMLADQIGERTTGPVFPSRSGTPLDLHNFRSRILKPILKRMGLAFGDLHTLRHFNATLMDSAGIPAAVRRKRLGHADASVTDSYTGTMHEDERAAAEKICDLILGALERLYPDCTLLRYKATSVQA
jgi:integrase